MTATGNAPLVRSDSATVIPVLDAEATEREFEALRDPETGILNAAMICCDRHISDGQTDSDQAIALNHVATDGTLTQWTFAKLRKESQRVAGLFANLGVGKGDRVAGLLPRTPELLITVLAAWRLGAVYQPLFTAFGPKAIEYRVTQAHTKVIVTNAEYRSRIEVADATIVSTQPDAGEHDFYADAVPITTLEPCDIDDPFLILFTSGTTGSPKSLLVPVKAAAAFRRYMIDAVALTATDRFWNIADPGWAYGLYYAIVGPLSLGYTTTFQESGFTPEGTYALIERLGITNLAGSPTAYRLLIGAGAEAAAPIRGQLRAVSSAGEPLNPEIIRWFAENLDVTIHDHYGQTETGMVLCNHHAIAHPIQIGAAGYGSPGHSVTVLNAEGQVAPVGEPGALALDRDASPMLWFAGYEGQETKAFVDSWYFTGDTCERNADGSISFVGRSDDVITTSGYRVGPFDVESALLEHEAVLESAVVGIPDPERTEIIKAFIVLHERFTANEALAEDLKKHVKTRLSAHAFPRSIEFVEALPKTPSGKIQRFLLRNQSVAKAS